MNYYVYVDGILGIKTNTGKFGWSYGDLAPKTNEEEYNKCKIKINLEIRKTKDVFDKAIDKNNYDKYNYFFAKKDERKIYYDRGFIFNSKLRYSIDVKDNCNIDVIVNKNYFRYVKYRFMNIHSIGYILTDLISGLLLINGYCTIHCSAVQIRDKTIVIFAPTNTGKTLTAMKLCELAGAKFIAEDIALTDGESIYAAPWTSTFSYHNKGRHTKYNKLMDALQNKIIIFQLMSLRERKSICEYLGLENIIAKSKITDLIVLGKGDNQVFEHKDGIFESIINLNKYEFNYHKSPSLLVLDYFNSDLSIEKMFNTEKAILRKLFNKTSIFKINANNPLDYWKLILEEIFSTK